MTKEELASLLPTKPRDGMTDWILEQYRDSDLGGEYMVYHREPVEIAQPLRKTMTPEDFAQRERDTKRRWGAVCTCTACDSDFFAGYVTGGGIRILQGEDGLFLEGYCGEDEPEAIILTDGDRFLCPCCLCETELVRKQKIRDGRTYQVMTISVEAVAGFAVLMAWMTRRRLEPDGYFWCETEPEQAVVLSESGRLTSFRYHGQSGWRPMSIFRDPQQKKYHDAGSINQTKVGTAVWKSMPDLAGTTAEKTGLAEYISQYGEWPVVYLMTWACFPPVENLVKAGWGRKIDSWIDREISKNINYGVQTSAVSLDFLDTDEVKPHRMLHMTKEELRISCGWNWTPYTLEIWNEIWLYGLSITASEFQSYIIKYGIENVAQITGYYIDGYEEFDIHRIDRYIDSQIRKSVILDLRPMETAHMLLDYWDIVNREAENRGMVVTEELLWPRYLFEAHEREAEKNKALAANDYLEGFHRVLEKCGELEWTDGDLCIRIPRNNGELVQEGDVLRHCVGGYGSKHAGGKDLIFFVRHYRRPERSYYTLNESIANYHPRRIQLHGYGNEHHGDRKQYRHKIPQKVLDFVDRWEREILHPWCLAMQAKEKRAEAETKRGRRRKTE